MAFSDWSTTAGSNTAVGGVSIAEGMNPSDVNNAIRAVMADAKAALGTKGADIASATTTDLGAVAGLFHDITGTTTITGFGTIGAGIWKVIKFEGALTLTHNATSLILPGAANITTVAGDIAWMVSEGSGNWRCALYQKTGGVITLATTQASTSGTAIDFTGIPAGTKEIIISWVGVSTDGTSNLFIRLGDAGGIETTGYLGNCSAGNTSTTSTAGFPLQNGDATASSTYSGQIRLVLVDSSSFMWSMSGSIANNATGFVHSSAGSKSLSAELTRIDLYAGGDTFDAGSINIAYL